MLFNGIQEEEGDENAKLFSHTSTNTSKRRTVPVQVQSIESLFSVLSGSQVRGSSFEELLSDLTVVQYDARGPSMSSQSASSTQRQQD
jgi:hypothetical protein